MPNPERKAEREAEDKERERQAEKAKQPPPKNDVSVKGAIDAIKERQKVLDEL